MFIKLLSLCNIIFDLKNCIDLVKLILLSLGKNMVYYKLNNDLYGIEIYFESKPDANVILENILTVLVMNSSNESNT